MRPHRTNTNNDEIFQHPLQTAQLNRASDSCILNQWFRTGRRFGGSVTNRRGDWSWALLKEPVELYEEAQEVRTGRSVPVERPGELEGEPTKRKRTGAPEATGTEPEASWKRTGPNRKRTGSEPAGTKKVQRGSTTKEVHRYSYVPATVPV